mmetsp:Transcript_30642/g.44544  ORF Transcript_30642/g.44544 Transcript_30642/m.44544 type:complete len:83 (-) Transcript_30642:286-534(-)
MGLQRISKIVFQYNYEREGLQCSFRIVLAYIEVVCRFEFGFASNQNCDLVPNDSRHILCTNLSSTDSSSLLDFFINQFCTFL